MQFESPFNEAVTLVGNSGRFFFGQCPTRRKAGRGGDRMQGGSEHYTDHKVIYIQQKHLSNRSHPLPFYILLGWMLRENKPNRSTDSRSLFL